MRALKPGGRLVCEFGGAGCCETIHAAIRRVFARRNRRYRKTFYFPTVGEYAPRLERNGLKVEVALLLDVYKRQVVGNVPLCHQWGSKFSR